jgi:PiT family inorganic phosphate transporter
VISRRPTREANTATLTTALLIGLVLAFAWSIGAHYTGACMGMAYGSGSIGLRPALIVMGVLALAGAALASHRVEVTVGLHLIASRQVTPVTALLIIAVAFALTTLYTAVRVPTSTIQILVFSVAGVALGAGIAVHWATVLRLAVLWVVAPPTAGLLGYVLTRALDRVMRAPVPAPAAGRPAAALGPWPALLVAVGAAASFTMGGNDVANATGALVMTHTFNVWAAGLLGGVGLLVGVLTWGRPLLQTVAFDIVRVDLPMATAAQLVQALVVLAAVSVGLFTSMNQALVGAMTGAGLARGAERIRWATVRNIVTGWLVGPPSGMLLGGVLAHTAQIVHLIH